MKNKILILLMALAMLAVTLNVSASLVTISQPAYLSQSKNTSFFTITANENVTINIKVPPTLQITDRNGNAATLTVNAPTQKNLSVGEKLQVNAYLQKDENFYPKLGIYEFDKIEIFAVSKDNATINETQYVSFKYAESFCKYGERGELEIESVEDKKKDNEDEWVWHPLDNIEIKVNNVYNGFNETKRIKVEYSLYDSNGKKLDLGEVQNYEVFSLKEGDEKDVYFDFRIPADVKEGTYKLFVKAYVKSDEKEGCVSNWNSNYYQTVKIEKLDDRAVVVDEEEILSSFEGKAMCGDSITLTFKVYNTGNEDEEKVLVNLYNKELGIDLDQVINNLDAGDYAFVTFEFNVPKNATEKSYRLEITTYYDYDDSSKLCVKETDLGCYDSNSRDDLEKKFIAYLTVQGNCEKEGEKGVEILANLITSEEEVKAGKEVIINVTLKNTGKEKTTYTIGAEDYEDWATLISLDPTTLTLNAGESKSVTIKLKINPDVEGNKILTVKTLYNNKVEKVQLGLSVSPAFHFKLPEVFKENKALLWITIVNIILIILIIIVAIRVSKKE